VRIWRSTPAKEGNPLFQHCPPRMGADLEIHTSEGG